MQIVKMSVVFDLDVPAMGTVLVVVFRRVKSVGPWLFPFLFGANTAHSQHYRPVQKRSIAERLSEA